MTLSQKSNLGKEGCGGISSHNRNIWSHLEKRHSCGCSRGRSCEEEGERPLINSICFANVLLARADMIIYTAVRRAMPTFLLVVKLLPTEITVMHSGISNVRWCRHLEEHPSGMMATPRKAWFCIVASRKIMAILSNDRSACGAARHAVATTANLGACRLPRRQRQ